MRPVGYKVSLEVRERISKALTGRVRDPEISRKVSETKRRIYLDSNTRSGVREWEWRDLVLTRDCHTCQHCRITQAELDKKYPNKTVQNQGVAFLHCHHIKDWDNFPELRYDVDNGITLCFTCHRTEERRLKKLQKILEAVR
jgi:hypothetical protein